MRLDDRFTRGFLAGIFAGIIMDIFEYLSFTLGIAELSYWEWASVLIYGYRTTSTSEILIAMVIQLIFSGVIGIIFAYLISNVTSVNHILKGIVFSVFVWFFANAVVFMFDVTPLIPVRGDTVLSNLVTISIYGTVMAETLRRISTVPGA